MKEYYKIIHKLLQKIQEVKHFPIHFIIQHISRKESSRIISLMNRESKALNIIFTNWIHFGQGEGIMHDDQMKLMTATQCDLTFEKWINIIPYIDLLKFKNNVINRHRKMIRQSPTYLMIKNLSKLGMKWNVIKWVKGYLQKSYS